MKFSIHTGKHRAWPWYWLAWFPLLLGRKMLRRRVTFFHDTKYRLAKVEDQADHNKLFGLSFLRPHRNSARFGWRYDPGIDKFILSAYCYVNGERIVEDLCECYAWHFYDCELMVTEPDYLFTVRNEKGTVMAAAAISTGHRKNLALLLGPYFGGNNKAPETLTFSLKKIRK
jgi:hypothetical protein